MTATADQLRASAAQDRQEAFDSFERCDTDGFMSQWASGLVAGEKELQAEIIEAGGRAMFPALFTTDGELVAAKLVDGQYGRVWGLLPSDDPRGRFTGWFNPSKASKPGAAERNDAKKGFYIGYVMAPAKAELAGGNVCTVRPVAKRTDGGFSRDVEIVDNGRVNPDGENFRRWYRIQDNSF